jgi:dTDP-4-amino-4,6-dideoxygalactose transaminase
MIPFNKPYKSRSDEKYLLDSLRSSHLAGDGPYTKKCKDLLEKTYRGAEVLLTPSCTAALEMAAILLDIQPGDEVIIPSFTFVSTANAFALRGADIVFCDIDLYTGIAGRAEIEHLITHRTKAIVIVQYAGGCARIDELSQLCTEKGITLIEDAAQSISSSFREKPVGSFGDLATISFHETKNIHCGEGGALVINNPVFTRRAEIIREKGTNRCQFFRGEVDRYTWQDIGSSYLLSDLQAAMLYSQLLDIDMVTKSRVRQYNNYMTMLSDLADKGNVTLPKRGDNDTSHNGHIFWLRLESPEVRVEFMSHMKQRDISTLFHYVPLHSSPYWKNRFGSVLENTDVFSNTLVRLPNYVGVDTDAVAEAVLDFF